MPTPLALRTLEFALAPVNLLARQRLYQAPIYDPLPAAPGCQKILFIGNSVTYYNDLPGLAAQLSAGQQHPLRHARVILPNTSLAGHRDLTAAKRRIDEGGWTYVVLQEYSSRPIKDPDAAMRAIRHWTRQACRAGAQPVLFENWPNRSRPRDFAAMKSFFARAREETGALLAPIGSAWNACRAHPEIPLYLDYIHPTVAGTYLAACTLFRALYHKPARNLPISLPGLKLAPEIAGMLQSVADRESDVSAIKSRTPGAPRLGLFSLPALPTVSR